MRAVELALALMAVPRGLDEVRARPLPPDMLALLKAAAGDAETLAAEAGRYRSAVNVVQEACATFVQQVLLLERNDPFRVLGCAPEADDEQLRQHFRWLQRWLHPDRDPEGWVSVFADRVNAAWNVLKRPERRAQVRAEVDQAAGRTPAMLRVRPVFDQRPVPPALADRRPWWQFLPHAVVGSSLMLAAALFWADRRVEGSAGIPGGAVLVAAPVAASVSEPIPAAPTRLVVESVAIPEPSALSLPALPVMERAAVVPKERRLPLAVSAGDIVVRPTPPAAAVAASTPAPLPVVETTVVESPPIFVLMAFRSAYQRGDTTSMMRLFTADALTASGGWAQTRSAYAELFAATEVRELDLHDIVWVADGAGWVGRGRFEARLRPHDGWRQRRSAGRFTVRLQPRAGTQRIVAWEQGGNG